MMMSRSSFSWKKGFHVSKERPDDKVLYFYKMPQRRIKEISLLKITSFPACNTILDISQKSKLLKIYFMFFFCIHTVTLICDTETISSCENLRLIINC